MPLVYTMTAEENYSPAIAAQWLTSSQPNFCFCDKQYIGTSFDRVRRNIMYSAVVTAQTQDVNGNVREVNATGQTLWTGLSATPPGNKINLAKEFVFQTAVKNIDSGTVSFYSAYDPHQLVPSGIGVGGVTAATIGAGGSGTASGTYYNIKMLGGTGEMAVADLTFAGGVLTGFSFLGVGNGYTVGDSLTFSGVSGSSGAHLTVSSVNTGSDGATWGRSVWDSQLSGGDVLAICDPRTGNFWVRIESCELHIFRPSKNFAMEISPLQLPFTLAQNESAEGAPIGVTADWVYFWANRPPSVANVMQILPSTITPAEVTADKLLATYTYTYPDSTYAFRQIIGPDGHAYIFGAKLSGTRNYKLWNCVPGVGFTDITPWSSSTGPNTDCAGWTTNGSDTPDARFTMMQLPASGNLALISTLLPADWSTPGNDPTKFRMDCTYYNIAGGTFDYHENMVYGYMDANWNPTVLATAAYKVTGFLEFDNDLEVSDYVHPGVDYTTRRFMFLCVAMSAGTPVDGDIMAVFVDYQFVYGHAPTILQVVPEYGWDNSYTAYGTTISQTEVVVGSLPWISASNNARYTAFASADNGIWDRLNGNKMWLSGDDPQFTQFNPLYTPRYSQALNVWNATTAAASSPFMTLNFSDPAQYCVPFCIGSTFTSQGQILRPASPQESQTQSGPSQGKKRRMVYAAPLLVDSLGISMGVDFLNLRPLDLKSPGGTVTLTVQQPFNGIYWGPVDANYNYDNMWCWQITRPYPATVVSVECQLETNENL